MIHLPLLLPVIFAITLAVLLQHFLPSLAWAFLLAAITWPIREHLVKRGLPPILAATIIVLALLLLFVTPSVYVANQLALEVSGLERLINMHSAAGIPVPDWMARLPMVANQIREWWESHLAVPGGLNELIRSFIGIYAPQMSGLARSLGTAILANALYVFLTLLTLFVIYTQGEAVIRYIQNGGIRILPNHFKPLSRLFILSVRGTALGLCLVALLEGVVLGTAYTIAGAPAPILLGIMTAYMCLIPGGGPLSFTLVSLFLLSQGQATAALGLFSWGAIQLFCVDKFIRPQLIGHRVQLPFLAVLFGLLGGVSTIGIIGLFVGPFLMAVLFWWLRGAGPSLPVSPPETVQQPDNDQVSRQEVLKGEEV